MRVHYFFRASFFFMYVRIFFPGTYDVCKQVVISSGSDKNVSLRHFPWALPDGEPCISYHSHRGLNLRDQTRAPILFYFIMFLFRALALLSGWVVSSISPSFCLFHVLFYFYLCFYLFSYSYFVFVFCFCSCLFRISLFQCISVADVCMLCLSYPVLGHDIAWSNALRCIISVSQVVACDHRADLSRVKNQYGHWVCWMSTSRRTV